MSTINPVRRINFIASIETAAAESRKADRILNNLMCRAVERGVTQTDVAKAAGVSQAHVSRTLAANRKADDERKARAATRRRSEGGTV